MTDADDPEIGFETALIELETIVAELERGGPGLTEALGRYEKGIRLLNRCQGLLDNAERSVALLTGVDAEGRAETAPFDASATAMAVAVAPAPVPATRPPILPKPRKAKAEAPAPASNLFPPTPAPLPLPGDEGDEAGPPW